MKQLYISLLFAFIFQHITGQPWVPLGSNEQAANSIGMTAAATMFTGLSNDGIPYISYIDDVGNGNNLGDFKTHAKRFINGQWEFAGDAISPEFPGSDFFPVALDGTVPYVAYNEAFNPVEIRFKLSVKRLNSNTGKWEVVGQQGISDASAGGTAIAAENGKIYVAYNDEAADGKVTVRFFDNANTGNGWKTVGTPGISNGFVFGINIVIDNGVPYVAYLDFGDDLAHVKKFNGTAWEEAGTNNPAGGLKVVIRSLIFDSHHTPYVTFVDVNGTGVVRNLNAAGEWITTGGQPFATGIQEPLSLAILHDIPFIAFGKKQNGITQINIKRLNAADNTWPDAGNQPVTASTPGITTAVLLTDNISKLFIVFRDLNGGLYAKTFETGGVLPVSLISFSVTRQNNSHLLKWITTSELDNKLFEIEHSTDAAIFKKIGETVAKGAAGREQQYNFMHLVPAPGINYYRLKQVDNNGTYAYSKIISIVFNQEHPANITLSPNPATNLLHVANLTGGPKELMIRNTSGKLVKRSKVTTASIDVNIADLPQGTYFISLYNDKITATKSFIKILQ